MLFDVFIDGEVSATRPRSIRCLCRSASLALVLFFSNSHPNLKAGSLKISRTLKCCQGKFHVLKIHALTKIGRERKQGFIRFEVREFGGDGRQVVEEIELQEVGFTYIKTPSPWR